MEDDDFYSMRIDMNSSAMPIFNEEWRLCDSPTQGFDCAVCNYNFCTSTRMGKLTAKHLKYDLEIWGEDEDGVKLFSISFDPFNMSCQARFTAGRHQTLNVTFSKR